MADPPSMLSQLRDISDRYLRRTLREADQLQELVSKGIGGDADGAKQTEQLAHKIHGSGAMFGFQAVSERAGQIERLVAQHAADLASVAEELTSLVTQLRREVHSAASERGIEG
ncbi:MAG: Hpt domain-containing protein [Steroidobacteraceae bacterium]